MLRIVHHPCSWRQLHIFTISSNAISFISNYIQLYNYILLDEVTYEIYATQDPDVGYNNGA